MACERCQWNARADSDRLILASADALRVPIFAICFSISPGSVAFLFPRVDLMRSRLKNSDVRVSLECQTRSGQHFLISRIADSFYLSFMHYVWCRRPSRNVQSGVTKLMVPGARIKKYVNAPLDRLHSQHIHALPGTGGLGSFKPQRKISQINLFNAQFFRNFLFCVEIQKLW